MDLKFPQSLLIFIVITLICSITPVMAIQTADNQLEGNSDQAYNLVRETILNNFDEGTNTELTPEQKNYLDQHEDRLINKEDAMLNNLQDFLNYLITEHDNYHPNYHPNNINLENPTGRKLHTILDFDDKYTKDAESMKDYLEDDEIDPNINGMLHVNCNYKTLWTVTNNSEYEKKYDVDHVIVQIKDPNSSNGYIRYLKLIYINETNVHLKSGTQDLIMTREKFEELYVWNKDGSLNNPDHEFNILVSPPDYLYTDYILRQIWDKQDSDLRSKETRVNTASTVNGYTLGIGGLGVAITGTYKLCEDCKAKAKKEIDEELPVENVMNEASPLLKNDGLKSKCCCSVCCNPCGKCNLSKKILATGTTVFIGSALVLWFINGLKDDYDKDHKNLNKYEPPVHT